MVTKSTPSQSSSIPLFGISIPRPFMFGLLSSQSILELNPSLSASKNCAMPSQSSSTSLLGNSVAPGLIDALLSSQSTSLRKPSPSLSVKILVTKSTPSQSSSIPLFGISIPRPFMFGLLSSQSILELNPSLSASKNCAMPSQSSSTSLFGNSVAPGLINALLSSQSTSAVNPSPSLSSNVSLQSIDKFPLSKVGISSAPFLLVTSIEVGEFSKRNSILSVSFLISSKHIWKITASSSSVNPVKKLSTQPTLNCPTVAALKLFSSKLDKLNCLKEAAPKAKGSHTIVY